MTDPIQTKDWAGWPLTERLVQLAAYHCDVLKVQEEPRGSNRGPWVDKYLASAGAEPGEPWCASFVTYLLKECGLQNLPDDPAAVINWSRWAEGTNRIVADPDRGDLFFLLHANGEGHIGIIVENLGTSIRTIEGNSNTDGSRDGYEVVRHVRPLSGLRFIRIN